MLHCGLNNPRVDATVLTNTNIQHLGLLGLAPRRLAGSGSPRWLPAAYQLAGPELALSAHCHSGRPGPQWLRVLRLLQLALHRVTRARASQRPRAREMARVGPVSLGERDLAPCLKTDWCSRWYSATRSPSCPRAARKHRAWILQTLLHRKGCRQSQRIGKVDRNLATHQNKTCPFLP